TSIGMAGAEVEVFDGDAHRVSTVHVDLERAVRALDFSPDGATLLVSLTARGSQKPALQIVSLPEGKVLREIAFPPEAAGGHFERGLEGRYLADGSMVARSGGKLLQWLSNEPKPREIVDLPKGAFLSTSPDKRWLIVSTPDEVTVRDATRLQKPVFQRARKGPGDGTIARAPAFVSDDRAVLFQDHGSVILLSKSGASTDL